MGFFDIVYILLKCVIHNLYYRFNIAKLYDNFGNFKDCAKNSRSNSINDKLLTIQRTYSCSKKYCITYSHQATKFFRLKFLDIVSFLFLSYNHTAKFTYYCGSNHPTYYSPTSKAYNNVFNTIMVIKLHIQKFLSNHNLLIYPRALDCNISQPFNNFYCRGLIYVKTSFKTFSDKISLSVFKPRYKHKSSKYISNLFTPYIVILLTKCMSNLLKYELSVKQLPQTSILIYFHQSINTSRCMFL